ncbi:MAG: hypothetical protein AB7Q23_12610 [Hyphomonadaceae bacterium]
MALAFALALGACDAVGAPERMPLADARANLIRVGNSGSSEALCTPEGRLEFRRAVRTFSAAADAEGEASPLMESRDDGDPAWELVILGLGARVVEPSDLHGDARTLATIMNLPGAMPQLQNVRDAMAAACPELMTFYREATALSRLQARVQAASERGDGSQLGRLRERAYRQAERLERAMQRLERAMRAAGWEGPEGQGPGGG